jgi:hypothetical protein
MATSDPELCDVFILDFVISGSAMMWLLTAKSLVFEAVSYRTTKLNYMEQRS